MFGNCFYNILKPDFENPGNCDFLFLKKINCFSGK